MATPLCTPRVLADLVIQVAHDDGIEPDGALASDQILALLAATGHRAVGQALRKGAGQVIRAFAEAAARKVGG